MTGREAMTVLKRRKAAALLTFILIFMFPLNVCASEAVSFSVEDDEENYKLYINDDSGYEILIDDKADIFTDDEENDLIPYMADCSQEGFVILVTTDDNKFGNAETYAGSYYDSLIPEESGILFLIDMDTRELKFYSEGEYHYELTGSVMNIIADNIYRSASNGDYYECAREAFTEISDVLQGKRIAAPMKYISNACLAVLIALIINYFIARAASMMTGPLDSEVFAALNSRYSFTDPEVRKTHTTRTYSPRSSGSGGSGGGGGGGGGHSSGGHSF